MNLTNLNILKFQTESRKISEANIAVPGLFIKEMGISQQEMKSLPCTSHLAHSSERRHNQEAFPDLWMVG